MTDENLKPEDNPPVPAVEKTEEKPVEEEKVEEKIEKPKEEEKPVEKTEETPPVEAPKEEPKKEEKPAEENKEVLEESLSVIKQVRTELANAYKTHKTMSVSMEQLTKENESLKNEKNKGIKTIESLNNELNIFKTKEQETLKVAYNKRLEQLSNDFKVLGQERSIEQLSALGKEVIREFEAITKLALANRKEEKLSTLTVPTQAMSTKKSNEQLSGDKPQPTAPEKLNFKTLCNTLTAQQDVSGNNSKRILNL